MDIKDIIKWFIPGLRSLSFLCVLLHVSARTDAGATAENFAKDVSRTLDEWTVRVQNLTDVVGDYNRRNDLDFSEYVVYDSSELDGNSKGVFLSRTFGRPMKKLMQALVPLAFQIGVASVWMVVSTILSAKGVLIGAAILKLLLIAGAVKVGTLFAHKQEQHAPTWIPQKEVHLHIHNTPQHDLHAHSHSYEEIHSPSSWNRDGTSDLITGASIITPSHAFPSGSVQSVGPHTINTPYGSYVRVGPPAAGAHHRRRRRVI